jgi:hypothetical protein
VRERKGEREYKVRILRKENKVLSGSQPIAMEWCVCLRDGIRVRVGRGERKRKRSGIFTVRRYKNICKDSGNKSTKNEIENRCTIAIGQTKVVQGS